ncbi:DEAD/DEAH box helicase [Sulfurospirillum sp. 1612]|uniref:DEAD/DEAH box helicase n=1 Tax=Sulfurospirillum sp. 1612 TaxID=3094835 RepID=UPI002F92B15C
MSFSMFNLSRPLTQALSHHAYITPTPIQKAVIPLILKGKDLLAQAQTGSGKSASFVVPILERWSWQIGEGKPKIYGLVLTPTRELTLQVAQTFETLGACFARTPKVVSLIGGEQIGAQLYAVQQGCDIVVATSGRLLDVISKKQMNLNHVKFFVLDEADRMLDEGFVQELGLVLNALPKTRQNLLFSATYPPKIQNIASKITQSPVMVTIQDETPTVANITQRMICVNRENRGPLLRHLLKANPWKLTLVFMANKRATDNIAVKFRKHGIAALSFHGDLDQEERNLTLSDFKAKKIRVLFATDIAARGLDIEDIDCVINFDVPRAPADYIHRIGRSARAGKSGMAISFVGLEDQEHFALIQKKCEIHLLPEHIVGFERVGEPLMRQKGSAPIKGKRKSKKDKAKERAAEEGKTRD